MKVFIVFALIAASQAAVILQGTGGSSQYRSEDGLGNYAFGYDEGHLSGGTFRKETGDGHGNVAGSYGLRDADGRIRVVNYVADAAGFRADIKTNEPGVEPKDPAHTAINKAIAPVVSYAAPVPAPVVAPISYAASAIAPVSYAAPAPIAPVSYAAPAIAPVSYAAPAPIAPISYAAPAVAPVSYAAPAPIAYAAHHVAAPHYAYAYHY